jgi:2-polyprenyl-6-methoxyphenol hydroxylase-like FAD-dependent oxidoreductase
LEIVVIGGSAAGAFAALLLARAGHRVLVLEQDRLEAAPDVETAARTAYRATAPHHVQPHVVMARCRELLMEYLPDVYEQFLAAGIAEAPLWTRLPAGLGPQPGDDCFTMLMMRRSTFDWVLRRTIAAEPGVTIRFESRVIGLCTRAGSPPQVSGVRMEHGELAADLVVDASGRRSPIDHWLEEIGAKKTATWWAECGVSYYSRYYRLRPGAMPPGHPLSRIVVAFDEFSGGIWGADNGAMQLAVVPLARDPRFKTVRFPEVFTAVMRSVPTFAAWLDVLEPVSEVYPMGAVHNTLRRLVVDGVPVATGLAAVGDSVCTTNPTLGRGLTFALSGAVDLVEAIAEHEGDWNAQAIALDRRVAEHIVPFYEDQVSIDRARLEMLDHKIFGAPRPTDRAESGRVSYAELRTAAQFDPVAARAFWKVMGMIADPEAVYTDPKVVASTRAALERHGSGPAIAQPTRDQLLQALATRTGPDSISDTSQSALLP